MVNRTELRVRYQETDAMKVVYYANYLVWFEIGRTSLMRQIKMAYKKMEEEGLFLPVTEASCKYKNSAKYDEEIIIETQLEPTNDLFFVFKYNIMRKVDNKILAQGETKHLCVDDKGSILRSKTKDIKKQLEQFFK